MAATIYGLTPTGFVNKQQAQISTEITAALQAVFGNNINTAPQSVFGTIVGIFSEREALLWQLCDAIYASQYPSGAVGTSVDNILALNNLTRLGASASTVNLLLTGTPGTVIPEGSIAQTTASPPIQFATANAATIAAAVNCVQTLFFSSVPNQGAFTLAIVDSNGNTDTTGNIYWMSPTAAGTSVLQSLIAPTSGSFVVTVNGLNSASLNFNCAASDVQAAIRGISGYGSVTVSGASLLSGFTVTWTGVATVLGRLASITSSSLNQALYAGNSIQDQFQALTPDNANYPFSSCTVTGAFGTSMVITFLGSQAATPQKLVTTPTNSLFNGSVAVNVNPVMTTIGSPAQVSVTAECVVTGPNVAIAGSVTVIGTPVSGWNGVTNPLDATPGTNVETDTQALVRRTALLSAQANGPVQAIADKVSEISGVTSALPLQNLTSSAIQNISWPSVPTTGTYKLTMGSGLVTASLAFNASAAQIQAAINVLLGYGDVQVSGGYAQGIAIQWGATSGSGAQNLIQVTSNSTGVTPMVTNGRPPHSFEIIVNYPGLPIVSSALEQQIGNTIWGSAPAGIQPYGSPIVATTGVTTASSNQLTSVANVTNVQVGMTVVGTGIPINTTITAISGSTITMSNNATITGTQNIIVQTVVVVTDSDGNLYPIAFSKPQFVSVYVSITLNVAKNTFPANGVQQIQAAIVAIGDALTNGQTVIYEGTNGLVGSFNTVPGIISYQLFMDITPSPTAQQNIPMSAEQLAQIESFNIICTVNFVA